MLCSKTGKRTEGCPSELKRTSETSELDTTSTTNNNKHPLMRPYHIRLLEYQKARDRIFADSSSKPKRSSLRIRNFYRKLKSFRSIVISPIISQDDDSRPFVNLKVGDTKYLALLDSGANRSVIGGALASEVVDIEQFTKCNGNVRTADGQRQNITGTVTLTVTFQKQTKHFDFLVVPTIKQDIICGFDFWSEFGLKISVPGISEIEHIESDPDKLILTPIQRQQLDKVISSFSNSETERLGCTTLLEHYIDTGDAKPIKQRYYPISPAVEKQLCSELYRMISLL